MTAIHERVANRARAADMPISAAGIAEIDRWLTEERAGEAAQAALQGYPPIYRHGQVNPCPGCGRSQWHVGRASAECAFCGSSLPFAPHATPHEGKDA